MARRRRRASSYDASNTVIHQERLPRGGIFRCAICLEHVPGLPPLLPCCGRPSSSTQYCRPCLEKICRQRDSTARYAPAADYAASAWRGKVWAFFCTCGRPPPAVPAVGACPTCGAFFFLDGGRPHPVVAGQCRVCARADLLIPRHDTCEVCTWPQVFAERRLVAAFFGEAGPWGRDDGMRFWLVWLYRHRKSLLAVTGLCMVGAPLLHGPRATHAMIALVCLYGLAGIVGTVLTVVASDKLELDAAEADGTEGETPTAPTAHFLGHPRRRQPETQAIR